MPTSTPMPWWFTPSPTSTVTPSPTVPPLYTATPRPTSTYIEDQLQSYGISLVGNIEPNTMQTILSAAQLLGKNYMPYMNASTPEQAFIKSNGWILFVQNKDAVFFDENGEVAPGNCETRINSIMGSLSNGPTYVSEYKINIGTQDNPVYVSKQIETRFSTQTIVCKEALTLENAQHEFGHTTPNRVRFDIFSNIMSIQTEDGTFIDQHLDGYWERQDKGFLDGNNSLEHQISDKESRTDGYAKIEQLADMLMNWNMEQAGSDTHGFSNDVEGTARRDFIEDLLKDMLGGQ